MNKEELIELVRKIIEVEGTEEEIDTYTDMVSKAVPHPEWTDLIYYDDRKLTPDQVVEEALAYKPLQL